MCWVGVFTVTALKAAPISLDPTHAPIGPGEVTHGARRPCRGFGHPLALGTGGACQVEQVLGSDSTGRFFRNLLIPPFYFLTLAISFLISNSIWAESYVPFSPHEAYFSTLHLKHTNKI